MDTANYASDGTIETETKTFMHLLFTKTHFYQFVSYIVARSALMWMLTHIYAITRHVSSLDVAQVVSLACEDIQKIPKRNNGRVAVSYWHLG